MGSKEKNFIVWQKKLLKSFSLLRDRESMIQEILKSVSSRTQASSINLMLLKGNPGKEMHCFDSGENNFWIEKSKSSLFSGSMGNAIREREIVISEPVSEKTEKENGITFTVPLTLCNEVEGIMNVVFDECREEDLENKKELLEDMKIIISFALSNARIYSLFQETMHQLQVSYDLSRSMISTIDLDEVIGNIFKQIKNHFGYDLIGLFVKDKSGNYMELEWTMEGLSEFKGKRLKIGEEGIVGRVAEMGKPYYAADVSLVPYYQPGPMEIKSEFAIPLKVRDELIGVLDISSKGYDDFSKSTRDLLGGLAAQIAMAIERSKLYEEKKELSKLDHLTGVRNRRNLEKEIKMQISRSKRHGEEFSILFLDIDNFKEFNDTYGHQKGDRMLKKFASILVETLREGDIIGRYGGDEFVMLLYRSGREEAVTVSERIIEEIARSEDLSDLTVSGGISYYPEDGDSFKELISSADSACYKAKSQGGNRCEF